jgi:hypothetical protein
MCDDPPVAEVITLYTRVPSHYADELDDIADAIRTATPGVEVVVVEPRPWERTALTWGEILNVVIPLAEGYVFTRVVDAVVAAARSGWERKQSNMPRPRPRYVNILGPDGKKIVKSVRIPPEEQEDDSDL